MFILYHKDSDLQEANGVSIVEKVNEMACILHSVSGFKLSIDLFHKGDVGNWGAWTQERIEESRFVVLLCSPRLAAGLRNPSGEYAKLDTDRGSFFTNTLLSLINTQTRKFIPIFFSDFVNTQWIPTALSTAARYTLDVDNFMKNLRSEVDTPAYYQEVTDALQMAQFEDWVRLVRHLRGLAYEVPPSCPSHPIGATGM